MRAAKVFNLHNTTRWFTDNLYSGSSTWGFNFPDEGHGLIVDENIPASVLKF